MVAASECIGWQTRESESDPGALGFYRHGPLCASQRLARIHAVDSGPDALQRQESDRTAIGDIGLSSKIRFREAFLFSPTVLSQRSSSIRDIEYLLFDPMVELGALLVNPTVSEEQAVEQSHDRLPVG